MSPPVATSGPEPAGPTLDEVTYVTVRVADHLLGIPIGRVHDVFNIAELTRVPLARPEVAGLLNLRGRVITAIDLRVLLGLPADPDGPRKRMAVGIDRDGDSFGLLVDAVGEVLKVADEGGAEPPVHLDPAWARLASALHRLPSELLVVLDVDAVLDPAPSSLAA